MFGDSERLGSAYIHRCIAQTMSICSIYVEGTKRVACPMLFVVKSRSCTLERGLAWPPELATLAPASR